MKKRILFLCAANASRSQMAEIYAKNILGDEYEVFSAGLEPTTLNPYAVQVIREDGLDMSRQFSKGIVGFHEQKFDKIITLCTEEVWPKISKYKPGECLYWEIKNPSRVFGSEVKKIEEFRKVRDEIKSRLLELGQSQVA